MDTETITTLEDFVKNAQATVESAQKLSYEGINVSLSLSVALDLIKAIKFCQEDKPELVGMLNTMAEHAEQDSQIYFGGDTTDEAIQRNAERQKRNVEDAAKYRRWAESLSL